MSEKKRRLPIDVLERDFSEAVDRLVSNEPRHPELRDAANNGRLRISPSTVAMEAGHSRTLIAMKDCRLPAIRQRILTVQRKGVVNVPGHIVGGTRDLREEVARLKQELASALEAQGEHFRARERAEREAAKWRDALRRMNDHAIEDAKVVPLRPRT